MDDKKVDGIKKMSKSELEKSRELVLDSINKYEKEKQPENTAKTAGIKKVDGISFFRNKNKAPEKFSVIKTAPEKPRHEEIKAKINIFNKIKRKKDGAKDTAAAPRMIDSASGGEKSADKKSALLKDAPSVSGIFAAPEKTSLFGAKTQKEKNKDRKRAESPKIDLEEKMKLRAEIKKAVDKDMGEIAERGSDPASADRTAGEKEIAEKSDLADNFLKKEEVLELKEKGKKDKKENEILKIKKKQEREKYKKNKEAEKKKRLAEKIQFKKTRKEKRIKEREKFKSGIKNFFTGLAKKIKNGLLNMLKILSAGIITFALFYTLFAVVLLKLDIDNKVSRKISEFFIVPAIITRNEIIEYYAYKEIKEIILENIDKSDEDSVKLAMAEMVVISNLAKKYSLIIPEYNIYDKELRSQITDKLALDNDINQVGINRIKKIKEMISVGGDFVSLSNKYGDSQDLVTISRDNEDQIAYSRQVKGLAAGEVSDIIYMPDGYYIFRCYEKSNTRSDLSYVFVKAKSLEEYISETIRGYRIWSLAK